MAYALDNALFLWQEGERRVRDAPRLEVAVETVLDELRRRLGASFEIAELAELYGSGTDWGTDLAREHGAGGDARYVVDAAFGRYARQAHDFAGGRRRLRERRR